jgi:serine-type D-Ala-D-Ala carboxypeptidase/endopeptidase (penicillin-binding protein 4)
MVRWMGRWAWVLWAIGSVATVHAQPDPLPAPVLAALAAAEIPADALAAVALPLRHRDRPYGQQPAKIMQPGSTMKLLTSIVALDQLGPNHRGFTELRSAAAQEGEVLQGDLVLRGGGDPEFGVPQLWALLVDLRQAGVRHIAGDLLLDRTRYRPARLDLGVPPFDESPEFPYNVIPDALHLGGALLPIELKALDNGVAASSVPPLEGLVFDSQMPLIDARCADWDDNWKTASATRDADGNTRITLNGAFPRGCTTRAELQLVDRNELAERLFRTLWRGLGGTLNGAVREGSAGGETRLLARRQARPWGELLRQVNKASDNGWARLLFLELGAEGDTGRTTSANADSAVRRWLAEQRIDSRGLVLDNGSGLSRSERASPLQLAQVLRVAYLGRHAADLIMSLPTAGVDGTLRNRLKDSPATGWARLKTGTLKNVVALAGYLNDARGRPWAVALIVNHDNAARARPVLDAWIDHFARSGPLRRATGPGPHSDGP